MAYEKRNEYTPPVFSFTDSATPRASRDNQGASSSAAYLTISDDVWHYQWNTQHRPIIDGTYKVDGATGNASTSYLLLSSSNSIDHERPSTSRASTEESTAILEDGATCRNATGTGGREQEEFCGVSGNVSNRRDALHGYTMVHTACKAYICKARD
nr:uncharacterized protein LOC129386613 [Dermacentor andersoni]